MNAAPDVDLDTFSGDPLEYKYFRTSFKEVVERRVHDQRVRLTRLLKNTAREANELIKHCVYAEEAVCFTEAIAP